MAYGQIFAVVIKDLVQSKQYDRKLFFTGPYTPKQIMMRHHRIILLRELYAKYKDSPRDFKIDAEDYSSFVRGNWTNVDDLTLIKGNLRHGYAAWKRILADPELWPAPPAPAVLAAPTASQPQPPTEENKQGESRPPQWQTLFDKIASQPYAEVVRASKAPDVVSIAQYYVEKYLTARLRYIVSKLEKPKAENKPEEKNPAAGANVSVAPSQS